MRYYRCNVDGNDLKLSRQLDVFEFAHIYSHTFVIREDLGEFSTDLKWRGKKGVGNSILSKCIYCVSQNIMYLPQLSKTH